MSAWQPPVKLGHPAGGMPATALAFAREGAIAQEPIGRMGGPDEIAAAILWLYSAEAAFTIGHAMIVDGGQTA